MKKEEFLKLLSRKLSREISATDSEILKRAVDNSEDYRLLEDKLETYFDRGITGRPKTDQLKNAWERIAIAEENGFKGNFDYSVPKTGFIYPKFLKVAAVLVLLTGFGMLGYHLLTRSADQSLHTVASTHEKTFRMLDDGTKVWLNKESYISYNHSFGKQKREIFLEGEAYFDVVKNNSIPLIIHAGNIDIEVKGTAFNVNAYKTNSDIQVALVRGSIEVTDRLDKKNKVLLKPNEKLILHHSISKNESNPFSVLTMASAALLKETRWTSDTLTFSKEKLKDLAVRMEKKYDMKIEVQSDQLKETRFSGTFTNETIQQALAALKLSYPLTYTISNRLVIIKDRG